MRRGCPEEARSRRALGHQSAPGCAGGLGGAARAGPGEGPGRSGGRAGRRAGSGSGRAAAVAAPRARSPSLGGGVHGRPRSHRRSAPRWGWGRPGTRRRARPAGRRPSAPRAPPRRPQPPSEEGAGTLALALPGAPAELGKPAARRPRPRPREGGGGPGASRPGSARGASSGLAGGAGRGAARGCGAGPHARSRSPPSGPPWVLPPALGAAAPARAEKPDSKRESGPGTSRLPGRELLFGKQCTRLDSVPHLLGRKRWERGLERLWRLPGSSAPFPASSASRSCQLSTGKWCRRHCRGGPGVGEAAAAAAYVSSAFQEFAPALRGGLEKRNKGAASFWRCGWPSSFPPPTGILATGIFQFDSPELSISTEKNGP